MNDLSTLTKKYGVWLLVAAAAIGGFVLLRKKGGGAAGIPNPLPVAQAPIVGANDSGSGGGTVGHTPDTSNTGSSSNSLSGVLTGGIANPGNIDTGPGQVDRPPPTSGQPIASVIHVGSPATINGQTFLGA